MTKFSKNVHNFLNHINIYSEPLTLSKYPRFIIASKNKQDFDKYSLELHRILKQFVLKLIIIKFKKLFTNIVNML